MEGEKVGGVIEGGGTVRVPVSRGPHWPVCVALFFWQPLGWVYPCRPSLQVVGPRNSPSVLVGSSGSRELGSPPP